MGGGRCVFNPLWMQKEEYKNWLVPSKDKYSFKCKVCKKDLELGTMGESALRSHKKSKFSYMFLLYL